MLVTLFLLAASFLLGLVFLGPAVRMVERVPQAMLFFVVLFSIYRAVIDLPESVPIGGMNVSPLDLACVVMLVFSAPYFLRQFREGPARSELVFLIFVLWAIVLVANFLLGAVSFGLQTATNEFRPYLYVIAIAVFVATREPHELWPRIEQVFFVGGALLVVATIVGYSNGDLSRANRPLPAYHALFLLQAAWIGLFLLDRIGMRLGLFLLSAGFLPVVVVLQHRSVWVVLAVSAVVVVCFLERIRRTFLTLATVGAVLAACVGFALFGDTLFEELGESYEEATRSDLEDGTSTFLWRIESWIGLLRSEQMNGPRKILMGNAFGSGWEREVTTSTGATMIVDVSPHNYYLQTLLRSGAVGLLLLCVVYWKLITGLWRQTFLDPGKRQVLRCLVVLLLCQTIFYIPYWPDPVQAILLGAALGFSRIADDRVSVQ